MDSNKVKISREIHFFLDKVLNRMVPCQNVPEGSYYYNMKCRLHTQTLYKVSRYITNHISHPYHWLRGRSKKGCKTVL